MFTSHVIKPRSKSVQTLRAFRPLERKGCFPLTNILLPVLRNVHFNLKRLEVGERNGVWSHQRSLQSYTEGD